MEVIKRRTYDLLLGYEPAELFEYFEVEELHGLYYLDAINHPETKESSYIAGLCNFIPNSDYGFYEDKRFIFINLNRCNTFEETICLIFHECMHQAFWLFEYDVEKEEAMITWAENETKEVINLIYDSDSTNY